MSIDRVNISNQGIERSQQAQGIEQVQNSGKDRKVPSATDAVNLSSRAKDIERFGNSLEESRAEQLERVRQALDSGTYKVSAKEIARKLIDANTK